VTNDQLFLVIGVPIIANAIITSAMCIILSIHFNARLTDLRSDMNARFTALEKLMDARFESLEREIHHGENS